MIRWSFRFLCPPTDTEEDTKNQTARESATTGPALGWVCDPVILSGELIDSGWQEKDSVSSDFLNSGEGGEDCSPRGRTPGSCREAGYGNTQLEPIRDLWWVGEGNARGFVGKRESLGRTVGFLD